MSPNESDKISKVYTSERKKLLSYIRSRVPVSFEAEDILQDVFYQLTLGFRDLERIENLTAWLYKVTNNRIIDQFRKKRIDQVSFSEIGAKGDCKCNKKDKKDWREKFHDKFKDRCEEKLEEKMSEGEVQEAEKI